LFRYLAIELESNAHYETTKKGNIEGRGSVCIDSSKAGVIRQQGIEAKLTINTSNKRHGMASVSLRLRVDYHRSPSTFYGMQIDTGTVRPDTPSYEGTVNLVKDIREKTNRFLTLIDD